MALVCLVSGCQPGAAPPDSPRLVVLYATCSLNKDFLSPYDSDVTFTPAFEEFASQAIVFRRHQTESGQSGTAFASLFSGSQAPRHQIFEHPKALRPEVELLTEAFAAGGYEVHSWLEHPMASARLGYAQGVSEEDQHPTRLKSDDPSFRSILERVAASPEARVLLVTNSSVTHGPYRGGGLETLCKTHPEHCEGVVDTPDFEATRSLYVEHDIALSFDFEATRKRLGLDDADVRRLREVTRVLYQASVVELDQEFGALIDAIDVAGLADTSLIAFTSDHGEIHFRDNAEFHWTHGFQLAPEVLQVPWLVRAAGLAPGAYESVTRSVDVLPTLAGLAGLPSPGTTSLGTDLAPALRGAAPPPELLAFSHTAQLPQVWWGFHSHFTTVSRLFPEPDPRWMGVGVRDGDRFYEIRHRGEGRWERAVYDLAADPGKAVNLFDSENAAHLAMIERLDLYKARLVEAAREAMGQTSSVAEEEQIELLRSIGYID
jgi:arylsulfatase A-like enzyme